MDDLSRSMAGESVTLAQITYDAWLAPRDCDAARPLTNRNLRNLSKGVGLESDAGDRVQLLALLVVQEQHADGRLLQRTDRSQHLVQNGRQIDVRRESRAEFVKATEVSELG